MTLRVNPAPTGTNLPRTRVWDRVQILLPATLAAPGTFKLGTTVQNAGFRRWRLKMRIVTTGGAPSAVNAIIILNTFGRVFERQIAIGPFPGAGTYPVVVEWGEGTAIETNDMGAFIIVGYENLGPVNVLCNELEFWQGG